MDVRCEKCTTIYEFDESRVGAEGVTVKCTQCGNLFKVKRRDHTGELPLGAAMRVHTPPTTPRPMPSPRATLQGLPPVRVPAPAPASAPEPAVDGWMIRRQNGERHRFRELTTLQQWIVERKVTRDDEISRSGEQWKRLGGIAELASFFAIVDAANKAPARHDDEDIAIATTAPMRQPELAAHAGPTAMGKVVHDDEPAFARQASAEFHQETHEPDLDDDDFESPAPRRIGLVAGVIAALGLAGGVGYLALYKRDAVRGLFGARADAKAADACRRGREYFLLDSDDAFRSAAAAFEGALKADDKNALALAGLAEVRATTAQYLKDDARAVEPGAIAQKSLMRQAQEELDDAKNRAQAALGIDPDAPEVNRAMADVLLVDGAPAAEVQNYLGRVTKVKPADAESAYLAGALAFRDGKLDDAKLKLTQANQLNQAATGHALLRATFLLARVDLQQNDKDGAKAALATVLAANQQHDRARALQAQLDGAAPKPSEPAVAVAAAPAPPSPPPVAAAPAPPAAAKPDKGDRGSSVEDYVQLVSQADHMSENGRARDARKLYEKALLQRPNGLEAIMGLGYCDLDSEKFSSAVDRFKRALEIEHGAGDAIIGLAEAYKLRGDRKEALSWYKRYLDAQPNGPKARMAKNNIRDLEPKGEAAAPEEKKPEEQKAEQKAEEPSPLPRPPTEAPAPN